MKAAAPHCVLLLLLLLWSDSWVDVPTRSVTRYTSRRTDHSGRGDAPVPPSNSTTAKGQPDARPHERFPQANRLTKGVLLSFFKDGFPPVIAVAAKFTQMLLLVRYSPAHGRLYGAKGLLHQTSKAGGRPRENSPPRATPTYKASLDVGTLVSQKDNYLCN